MKYMGSKARIAKYILPIILKDRREGQWYVEPFVGGANMIDKVDGSRIGSDLNYFAISALKLIRDRPFIIPSLVTEAEYAAIKQDVNHSLHGLVAFEMSFGAKFWGGYRRDKKGQHEDVTNMINQTMRMKNAAAKQSPLLASVELVCSSYFSLSIPDESIIYCDPPYAKTTKYKGDFDHDYFWQWCRDKCKEGHQVFVSEYSAPDDFICVWKKEIQSGLNTNTTKKGVEKLFIHESQLD